MTQRRPASPPPSRKSQVDPKKDRLAKALKKNLLRRKAAARPRG